MDPGSSLCLRVCLCSSSACLGCDDEAAGHSTFRQARAPLGCVNEWVFSSSLCLVVSSGDFVPMSWGRQRPPALAVGTGRLGWAAKGKHQVRTARPKWNRVWGISISGTASWVRCWVTKLHRGSAGHWYFLRSDNLLLPPEPPLP